LKIDKSLVAIDRHVIFTWIPSHIGIYENTIVDQEAKDALDNPLSNCSIPYTDVKPLIVTKYFKTLARQLGPGNS
jgi:ribonuclease HI